MSAMRAGGGGSAVREPCAEPVTGGDEESTSMQWRTAAAQEGGREGQGRRAAKNREEREGANAQGNANEPTESPVPGAETTGQREGARRRGVQPPPTDQVEPLFPDENEETAGPHQSRRRTRSRRDRTDSGTRGVSRWCVKHPAGLQVGLAVGTSGSARRVVPIPDAS